MRRFLPLLGLSLLGLTACYRTPFASPMPRTNPPGGMQSGPRTYTGTPAGKGAKAPARTTAPKKSAPATTKNGGLSVTAFSSEVPTRVAAVAYKAHANVIHHVAPFWYHVDSSGTLLGRHNVGTIPNISVQNRKLIPLVNDYGAPTFLHSAAGRAQAASQIAQMVARNGYGGVNIDFEPPRPVDVTVFPLFLQTLKSDMPKGTIVTVDIVPHSPGAYNYPAIAAASDRVIVMAYDQHSDGTPPGPVASYPWVSQTVKQLIASGLPASKIDLGLADYGYDWAQGSTKATTVSLPEAMSGRYGALHWSQTNMESYSTYTSSGTSHILWVEDARAIKPKLTLAKALHLHGVAYWQLGYEDEAFVKTVAMHAAPQGKG